MAQWPVSMGLPPGMYYNMPADSGVHPTQSAFPGMQQPTMIPVAAHSRGMPQSLPKNMAMPVQAPTTIDNSFYTSFSQKSACGAKSTVPYKPIDPFRGSAHARDNNSAPTKYVVAKKSKNSSTQPKQKRVKDPAAPKKPPPAFLKWSIKERQEVKRVLGNISPAEVSKELGHRWSNLNPAIKDVYKQKYIQEKAEYDKCKAAYVPSGEYMALPKQKRRSRKTKRYRHPNAPRKPPPAFLKWSMEERDVIKAEIGPLKPADMGKELGRRWGQLNAQVKLHFQEQYKEEKRKYDIERGKYEPIKQAGASYGKTALKKPPPTFLKWAMFERIEIKKNLGNLSFTEMGKELGRRWAIITPEVKAVYKEKYEQEKLEYEAMCQGDGNQVVVDLKKEQSVIYHEERLNLSTISTLAIGHTLK